ncbi:sigma-70 family RNA polymerase sigma factor [Paludisphaera mucosa]|uniref:Sigma-70 family RNA polymerase sigma factor n=1 Tax=Paludisphaera mucosa TaxID=3030827 RepID=A0ABT6FAN3_9BACT|nr:sigma-70 family RNA polymerase sigma factor [Paludisphaera mucosa]MDG3004489.1 sigma-70 family RNA polymerase sigma factor [Paludisphaera mucosa]
MLRSSRRTGREVERLLRDGVDPPGGDARLLHRYLAERDEAAFEAIVDRHGPSVLALCRRYLRDPADVEDAFQATFLILVRKGRNLRDGDALSSWLYGVAYRVAVRARSEAFRRQAREGKREAVREALADPEPAPDDSLETLDRELSRLPEKYRAPLVLCYLKGRTHDQAAAELGWPVGTVRSRMARARTVLHQRLMRQGVDASASLAMLRADLAGSSIVPSSLVATTVAAVGRFVGLSAGLVGLLSASPPSSSWPAAALAQGVLSTMSTPPWKLLGFAFASVGLTAGAFAVAAGTLDAGLQEDPPRPPAPPVVEKPVDKAAGQPSGTRSAEDRLSQVEEKLDRLIGLMAKPTDAPPPAVPPPVASRSLAIAPSTSSIKDVGEAIGLKPAALSPSDARSLREIEAQLVSAYRKYKITESYLGKTNDFLSELQAQSLREDAVAPARVLLARLRELEDQALVEEAESRNTLKDRAGHVAEARKLLQREEAQHQQNRELEAKFVERPEELGKRMDRRTVDRALEKSELRFKDATEALNSAERESNAAETGLKYRQERITAVRRLLTWAQEHFQDVMLTIDDAAPVAK